MINYISQVAHSNNIQIQLMQYMHILWAIGIY